MLKKMRWRFIGAAMAAFTAVVLSLLCFVNLWNYHSVTSQQDALLADLMKVELQGPQPEPPAGNRPSSDSAAADRQPGTEQPDSFSAGRPHFSPEVRYSLRFFAVHYNLDGSFVKTSQDYVASLTKKEAKAYGDSALSGGKTRDYESGYRYLVQKTDTETVVLFLNSERELQTMRSLLGITLMIAVLCLAVVFGLIVLFSRRAILPYQKNIEAQKQFITNASHELKTPLTAIATSADVLAMEHGGNEWVQSIQMQTARLSRLVTNLVTLSRLDEENPFPARTQFSLSEALWEITEPYGPLARAKGRQYTQDIAEDLLLTGDRTAIQQMLSILLDNALKYSPEGGIIALSAQRRGKKIAVTVSNTLDPSCCPDLSRLFDRFYRADESHSSAVKGTGIGLSIAKATAEAHGGKITAGTADGVIRFEVIL